MRFATKITLAAAVAVVMPVSVWAQTTSPSSSPTSVPTTAESIPDGSMFAVVDEVTGNVQVRVDKNSPWMKAVPGMKLIEGSEIRTGVRSAAKCTILPDQTFVLDRLTTLELTQSVKQGKLVKTDLTMKYGRTQYQIEKAGLDHEAAISSPGATLAVRGTEIALDNSPPFAPRAVSYTGRAMFSAARRTSAIGAAGSSKASMDAGNVNAANQALLAAFVDPQYAGARTKSDKRLLTQQLSLGATARFDQERGINVVSGGTGPARLESDLVSSLPGNLSFVARWTNNVDVNLQVGVSKGDPATNVLAGGPFKFNEFIYPGFGLNVSKSGGRIDFDHQGGANGGQEIVYWKGKYPVASYGIGVALVSNQATDVTLNAFLNGQKLPMFATAVDGVGATFSPALETETVDLGDGQTFSFLFGKSTTFTIHLEPQTGSNSAAVNVYIPLAADHPLSVRNDLNNGAPANLPSADNTAPNNSLLKNAKFKAVRNKSKVVKPSTSGDRKNTTKK